MTIARDAQLWRKILDARLAEVHTAIPGKVTAFDSETQTVDVQPMIKHVVETRDGGEIEESYPELYNVPVMYPRGGTYFVAFPLVVGDFVTLLFNEWSIDRFRDAGTEQHPVDTQRHAFSGAVALPCGPFPTSAPIGETVEGLILGKDGGALVRIGSDGIVQFGASAATMAFLAMAQATESRLGALESAMASHMHPTAGTGAPSPPSPPFVATATPVAATKVKGV
jgi:hypothetical protein